MLTLNLGEFSRGLPEYWASRKLTGLPEPPVLLRNWSRFTKSRNWDWSHEKRTIASAPSQGFRLPSTSAP